MPIRRSDTPDADGVLYTSDDEAEPQNTLYTQLLLYALGVCLANALSAALVCTWGILSGFRDAMLWALLCSVAMRDVKEWLVKFWQDRLSQERCVLTDVLACITVLLFRRAFQSLEGQSCRTLLALSIGILWVPVHALTGTVADISDVFKTWKRYALEFEADYRRQKAVQQRRIHEVLVHITQTAVLIS